MKSDTAIFKSMAASRPANRLAVISIILGVVGLLTSVIFVGIVFGIAAVVTGCISRSRALRGEGSNSAAAVVGIVIGVMAIVVGLGLVVLLGVLNSDPCWPVKQHAGCY
jgi:hypothetical protein